ncbi:MAG TPA: AAA family ATPase [Candidatus Aquilonibacter sp.]|nr:AAA family ATPase [Candidatus Aquilonibacter sp.]
MRKPYLIRVSSQNGGVGKTVVAVNLATALSMLGYKTLLIDGDTLSPAVGFYLGLKESKENVRKVFFGKMDMRILKKINIRDALLVDERSGLHVLQAIITANPVAIEESNAYIVKKAKELKDYDFVISDTHSGIYFDSILKKYDEVLTVSLCTLRSIQYAIQFNEICRRLKVKNDIVLNNDGATEPRLKDLEDVLGKKILLKLSHDQNVIKSEIHQLPAVLLNKNSSFSRGIHSLAKTYIARAVK